MHRIASIIACLLALLCCPSAGYAQMDDFDDGFTVVDNSFNPDRALDSLKASHKEIPKGMTVWTIDEKFGDIRPAVRDTAQHLFMNSVFTTGRYGEYNTTGNLGAPRIERIATDRELSARRPFLEPYSFFLDKPDELKYTNTLSPLTNLFYAGCGSKVDGEDHLRVLFATNVNKDFGVGFKFNYMYGRGYYQNQANSLFDYTMWASYLGQRYQAHLSLSFDHLKTTENGGIADDNYITHPEAYKDSYDTREIPTLLSDNWNKQDAVNINFSHRYNVGFYRKVPLTEMEKEARRFAIRSQQENKAAQEAKKKAIENNHDASRSGQPSFAGRPDDAPVQGDLKDKDQKRDTAEKETVVEGKEDDALDESKWIKEEYVPVTSFIHTLALQTNNRRYISNATPAEMYLHRYPVPYEDNPGDSIFDKTKYYTLKNTLAVGMLEGFNKYMPMGLKVFLTHELRHYSLPNAQMGYTAYNENNISVGGQIIKTQGRALHYGLLGEFFVAGKDVGDVRLDGDGDVNMRLLGDTAAVKLRAYYHLTNTGFIQRNYHGKFFSWNHDDFKKQMQTHLEVAFNVKRTRTALRACYDNLQNYTYLGIAYNEKQGQTGKILTGYTADMMQESANISLITLQLEQNFRLGILNWENRITYQKSSKEEVLAVPAFNYWTNLYLNFRIARVLAVNFGADMRYFSRYEAPEYCPQLLSYAVQQNPTVRTMVGNYPIINVYANFKLKQCRFFVMYSHLNADSGNKGYFLTPHYPLNPGLLRFGLSWDFNN